MTVIDKEITKTRVFVRQTHKKQSEEPHDYKS